LAAEFGLDGRKSMAEDLAGTSALRVNFGRAENPAERRSFCTGPYNKPVRGLRIEQYSLIEKSNESWGAFFKFSNACLQ
jgi:hypothetical protein